MNYSLGVMFSVTAGLLVMSIVVLMALLRAVHDRKNFDKWTLYALMVIPMLVGLFICLYPAIIIAKVLLEELEQCRMLQVECILAYVAIAIASIIALIITLVKIVRAEKKLNTNSKIKTAALLMFIVLSVIITLTIVGMDLKEFEEAAAAIVALE